MEACDSQITDDDSGMGKLMDLLLREEAAGWPSLSKDEKSLERISGFKKENGLDSIYEAIRSGGVGVGPFKAGDSMGYMLLANESTLVIQVYKDYHGIEKSYTITDLIGPIDFSEELNGI